MNAIRKPGITLLPALTLFLLSPLMAEIIVGSTPVSRFKEFAEAVGLYGAGALFIREVVRRWGLGWFSVAGLGLVFGIMEEALSLQTVFNPDFFTLDISFGRAGGVNWVWAMFIIPYHALWSIAIPIYISELFFFKSRKIPWLNQWGLWATALAYLFMILHYHNKFYALTQFNTSITNYISACAVAGVLAFIAIKWPAQPGKYFNIRLPGQLWTGIISFVLLCFWFSLFTTVFIANEGISPLLIIISGMFIMAMLGVLIQSCNTREPLTITHGTSLVLGCVMAQALYGALVLSESNDMWDRAGQLFISTLLVVFLLWLRYTLIHGIKQ